MKKGIILISAIVVIVVLIAVTLAKNKKAINANNKVVDRSGMAIPVSVTNATEGEVSGDFTLPAVLQPMDEANISANAAGKLKTLNVELGSHVNKGQVIGSVDNSLKEINLASTQLLVDKYQADYQKFKELFEGHAGTEADYINAKYNLDNAKTQIAQIKQQIADGQLISPLSGTIVKKNISAGEFVNIGTVVAAVVDVSKLKANVMVSETQAYKLKEGMAVNVTTDIYPGKEFKGIIRYISPKGDDSHNYQVEVNVTNESASPLKAGTFVRTGFDITGKNTTLQIPKNALAEGMKNPYVYTIKGDRASVRKLVLGREIGDNVEVLNGLSTGEQVIISGQINLAEGSLIQVVNTK